MIAYLGINRRFGAGWRGADRSPAFARLIFLFFFIDRNRVKVLRFEDLTAIEAADIIDPVAAIKKLGSLVLTTLHSEITPILD